MAPAVHNATPPASANLDNGAPIVTGTGFTVDTTKSIAGISFYVPGTNTGTYTVGLYQTTTDDASGTGTGTLLASASISSASVTAGTWADVLFSSPVTVNPGTAYRTARHASSGRYVSTAGQFTSVGMSANGITFYQTGADPIGLGSLRNGMFSENASMVYPNQTFNGSDYFVDVVLASSSNDAVVSGSVPALAGSLTVDQQYGATIGGAVPSLAGSLTGDQQYPTTISGTFAGVSGSLAGDEQYPVTIGGTLPVLSGSLGGDSLNNATILGNAPTLAGVVTADALTDAVVAGSVPGVAGTLLLDQQTPTLDMVLAGSLPALAGWLTMGNDAPPVFNVDLEVTMNRLITKAFIDSNPTEVVLVPRRRYRTSTGAWKYQRDDPRPMQVMRLIEQGPPEILTTPDGIQRSLDYVLLAEWNAVLEPNDVFEYDGDLLEVLEVYHDNAYEIRAAVTRKLDPP